MTDVSRETSAKLDHFYRLLGAWSPRINLVGRSTIEGAADRHVADSLQLIGLRPDPGASWLDLGSGGGFPGIVSAAACPNADTRFTLVESDQRKAAFLRRVVAEAGLTNTLVLAQRIETLTPQCASTISARALAPLPKLLGYVAPHLAAEGIALLMKGRQWRDEVREAQQSWAFDMQVHPSKTDPDAAVLAIGGLHAR